MSNAFERGYEFDFMSQRPMYEACPRWLIDRCNVGGHSTVVDLGCGSGILTRELLTKFQDSPAFRVIAIDPSPWELQIARASISDPRVTFIHGRAQEALNIVKTPADAVLLCNVVHQVPIEERPNVLEGAFQLVRPGGFVGMNTLFYSGGIEPETRMFYIRWMTEARRNLTAAGIPYSVPNDIPVALHRLTPQEHYDLLEKVGYEAIHIEEVPFDWSVEDWEALSKYSVFIEGALSPEMDLEQGSKALIKAVHSTYKTMGIGTIRRGWLHCVAQRPAAGAQSRV